MNIVGIIPARMGSSRFPGKPLMPICGIPMIGHVYLRSKMCKALSAVYVATCDTEIEQYLHSINGNVIMTSSAHERASDRTAEALLKIEETRKEKIDIVVMIQGDEPMLVPEMIEQAVRPLYEDQSCHVVNLMACLTSEDEQKDQNEIKVVVDLKNFALYFSRSPIPYRKKDAPPTPVYKQVCIIPFRRNFLLEYNNLATTPLEKAESIDMLRVLEHGHKVKMVLTSFVTYSVDTPDDLREVEEVMKGDSLISSYQKGAAKR